MHTKLGTIISFSRQISGPNLCNSTPTLRLEQGNSGRSEQLNYWQRVEFCLPSRFEAQVTHCWAGRPGRTLVTGSGHFGQRSEMRFWDVGTGLPCAAPLTHWDAVHAVDWSPDGESLATACGDGNSRVFELPIESTVGKPLVHPKGLLAHRVHGRQTR